MVNMGTRGKEEEAGVDLPAQKSGPIRCSALERASSQAGDGFDVVGEGTSACVPSGGGRGEVCYFSCG